MTQDWRQSFTSLLQEFKEAAREHSDGLHLVVKDSPNTSLEALWARLDGHESLTNSTLAIATPCNERESAYFAATEATIDRFKELANLAACLLPIDMYSRDPIHEFTYPPVLVPGHVEWWLRFVYSTLRRHPGILFGIDDGSSRLIGNLPIAFLNVNIFAASAIAIEDAILPGGENEGTQQRQPKPATPICGELKPNTAGGPTIAKPMPKKGEAEAKINSFLLKHHEHENGQCGNYDPVSNREIARQVKVSPSSVTNFFNKHLKEGKTAGRSRYENACADSRKLDMVMKMLAGELRPAVLWNSLPRQLEASEDER